MNIFIYVYIVTPYTAAPDDPTIDEPLYVFSGIPLYAF